MLRCCFLSLSSLSLIFFRLDCRLLQGIKKRAELSIASFKIDIYSSKDSFFPVSMTIAFLPVCSWQDGKWIKEEKSASLRDTDEPGTWCFVLSSF